MIRPANSVDAFALTELLQQTYAQSRYFGEVGFNHEIARRLFAQSAQRHGGTNDGATFLLVSERDGTIEAFILGALQRIYMVLDGLCASDVFLIAGPDANPRAMQRLIDGYIDWAEANPKVYEIGLSWADTVPGSEIVTAAFERRGFKLCAKTYRRTARENRETGVRYIRECVAA